MKRLISLLTLLVFFSFPSLNSGYAAVSSPWSTTYNCAEWTQSSGAPSCDGLQSYGSWTCNPGAKEEQITAAANNPNGGGGRGQRQWVGDGANVNSGGLKISFLSAYSELWVRWYMRYQNGFKWNPLIYDKILYFNPGESRAVVPEWYGADQSNVWTFSGQNYTGSGGWTTIMGGSASDGQWHAYEVHLKMDTNGSNGTAEMWIDGIKRVSHTNVNFGTQSGWTYFVIGENQSSPNNGGCFYVDFDDISVSITGYIGLITNTLAPAPPSSLTVQ